MLLAALALTSPSAVGQSAGDPHHLRVIWSSDPAHTALVSWTTAAEGDAHRVHYDTVSRGGDPADYAFTIESSFDGEYEAGSPFFHHAPLVDLEPATKYFFVVESDGKLSPELHFVTAHDDDRPFKLLYGGDSRTGRTDRQNVNRRISRLHEEDPDIAALVHGGDYIEHANSWGQWSDWLEDHELTFSSDGRVLPIVPAKGNHEGRGTMYNRVFGNPGGSTSKTWFTTKIGDLTLINLDTEVSQAGEQRDWLERELETGRASKWLVVNYHRPAYPAVKSPSGAKEHWVPLFEQFDVDMVCESDGHTLKRTPPIRNDRIDYTGVVYVGEGGLGVPQRTPDLDRWYLQAPGMATAGHHVQLLSFEPELLRYGAILEQGVLLDEITIATHEERLQNKITATMATAPALTRVEVIFSKAFDPDTVSDLGNWAFDPPVDVESIASGSEVDAVLDLVNTATFEELDEAVGLDRRAAQNIVDARDDDRIESWDELDAIPQVGPAALEDLADYAMEHSDGENPRNAITMRVKDLDPETVYRVFVTGVTDLDGNPVVDGTTVSFVYGGAAARADAITGNDTADGDGGGCTTASGSPQPAAPLFLLVVVAVSRRRRRALAPQRRTN